MAQKKFLKVYAYDNEPEAKQREAFLIADGYKSALMDSYETAIWSNSTHDGVDDLAEDPTDGKVWVVIANK